MSRAVTTALLERCFAAFNAGDHAGLLENLSDDVVLDLGRSRREIGTERLRWLLAQASRHFQVSVSDIVTMTDEGGGRAAAEFTLRGRHATADGLSPASGRSFSEPGGIFVEIDDDLVTRLSIHLDMASLGALLETH